MNESVTQMNKNNQVTGEVRTVAYLIIEAP